MKTAQLIVGNGVLWKDVAWKINRIDGNVVYLNSGFASRAFDQNVLYESYLNGSLKITDARFINDSDSPFERSKKRVEHLESNQFEQIRYRKLYCEALRLETARGSITVRKKVIGSISDDLKDDNPPSPSTLNSWFKRYENSGFHPLSLLDNVRDRGNRQRRLDIDLTLDIKKGINKFYLRLTRPTKKHAFDDIEAFCNRKGHTKSFPSNKTISKILVDNFTPYDICRLRYGESVARAKFFSMEGHVKVDRYLERVEMDARMMDILIVDDHDPNIILGRPGVMVLKDCFTSGITGASYFYSGESAETAVRALIQSILFKNDIHKKYPEIESLWQFYGLMESLVVDAGPGFMSENFEKVCFILGISVQVTRTKSPNRKGSVESFFNHVKKSYESGASGQTLKNARNDTEYEGKKYACIRQSVFERTYYKWIINVNNNNVSEIDAMSPNQKLERELTKMAKENKTPYLPSSVESVKQFIGTRIIRTIAVGKGIKIFGHYWNSIELQNLRLKLGNDKVLRQVEFYVDTEANNLMNIRVYDHVENKFISVPTTEPDLFAHVGFRWLKSKSKKIRERYGKNASVELSKIYAREINQEIEEEHKLFRQRAKKTSKPKAPSKELRQVLLQADMEGAIKDDEAFGNDLVTGLGLDTVARQQIQNFPDNPSPESNFGQVKNTKSVKGSAQSIIDDFDQIDIDEGEDWDDEL